MDITEKQLDNSNDSTGISECRNECIPMHDPRTTAGKLLLTLKERHRLSQAAISFTVESVRALITDVCDNIKASPSAAGAIVSSEGLDPFCGLDTEYLRTKLYQECLGLVVSIILLYLQVCCLLWWINILSLFM